MPQSRPRPRPLHRARKALSLGVVGLLALPLISWSNVVLVEVDGQLLSARTYASTVGDVLDQLEVTLNPADRVVPALDVPVHTLRDDQTVTITRAITVEVVIDGEPRRQLTAPLRSVGGFLRLAGIDARGVGARVEPGVTSLLDDGDRIELTLPRPARVTVDGRRHEVATFAPDVDALLDEVAVVPGPDDLVVLGPLDTSILRAAHGIALGGTGVRRHVAPADTSLDREVTWHLDVTIVRVTYEEVVDEVVLDHGTEQRETTELLRGTTRVADEGEDGLRHDIYRIERHDGRQVARRLVGEQMVREPRDRVVLIGTREPPPPPPPPPPRPAPTTSTASGGGAGDNAVWDRPARCESGGNWQSRGRYHGGLQFHPQTWAANKPPGAPTYAYEATREQQIAAGRNVQRRQGWGAWPHCSRQLGLR